MIDLVGLVGLVDLVGKHKDQIYIFMFLLTISTTAVAYVVSVEASQLEPHCEELSNSLPILDGFGADCGDVGDNCHGKYSVVRLTIS